MTERPTSRRRAGLLLHPTSLPGEGENGELGPEAHRFLEFLAAAGITVWQMLPIAPTHGDRSPYTALSVHAGNPALISLDWLRQKGWLDEGGEAPKEALLQAARAGFEARATEQERSDFEAFRKRHAHWLDDYALFQAIRRSQNDRHWLQWPEPLRDCDPGALRQARAELFDAIEQSCFEQFLFFTQWRELHDHARHLGIHLFGDVPIFVAHDSAEVWRHRELFTLDEHGNALTVAGVPPDYFSETGQRWGNPHYRWERMAADGFAWWKGRIATQLELFDWLRIDHFRGFQAYWEIPAHESTAINGRWVEAPGDALFQALQAHFDSLPLVAEDLGIITPEVEALRKRYGLPGMKILQFAFDGDAANPYLLHNHSRDSVVYTGTHDNDTTLGWYHTLDDGQRARIDDYLGHPGEEMPWSLIRHAYASVAGLAVIPMQDALALGSEHRMNIPGTVEGNWRWRFQWEQVGPELAPRLRALAELYGRLAGE